MAAAGQAQVEERRSLAGNSPGPTTNMPAKPQGCKLVIDGATLRMEVARRGRKATGFERVSDHGMGTQGQAASGVSERD